MNTQTQEQTKKITLDIYKNVYSPSIVQNLKLEDWFQQIKKGKYSEKIVKARNLEKKEYNNIKKVLPCCTFNFNFEKEKLNSNIKNPTGILYIDVDDEQFDINILDKNKVLAYYHSFGGKGYCILVKVTGLNLNNFKSTYLNICTELGIIDYIDVHAIKATQFNVISHDKNIFINYNSITFTATINEENKYIKKRDTTPIVHEKKEEEKRINGSVPFFKLKFKLELEDYKVKDCVNIEEGRDFYECYIPFDGNGKTRILRAGERHTVITMYFNNLLCLNPHMGYKQACVTLKSVIASTCEGGIPEKDIEEIINYKYKQLEADNLKPVGVRTKKWWVNPDCNNKTEAYNNARKEPTINKLNEFFGDELCNIKYKVTYKYIANWGGLSEKTIKRRITEEQKQLIKEHNKQIKGGK